MVCGSSRLVCMSSSSSSRTMGGVGGGVWAAWRGAAGGAGAARVARGRLRAAPHARAAVLRPAPGDDGT